jgi:DNA-binding PadR family transcriptional regulator
MTKAPTPESHLPLSVPVHQTLLSLAGRDQHGYSIIQDIRERTSGDVELTASTLYGALSRMLEDQLISEVTDPKPQPEDWDSRRRYYRVTEYGREVARAEARRLSRTMEQARETGLGPEPEPQVQKGEA